jgi:hypothetical protein
MIFETSMQARFLVPMAISLGFGVMFTTFVILVLVPVLYAILQKITGNDDKDIEKADSPPPTATVEKSETVSNSDRERAIGADLAAATEALDTP